MTEQDKCESDRSPDERSAVHGRAGERGIDRMLNRWIKGVVKVRHGSSCERRDESTLQHRMLWRSLHGMNCMFLKCMVPGSPLSAPSGVISSLVRCRTF